MAMTFVSYTNPIWLDAANTTIEAMVTFRELAAPVPYTASANDPDPMGAMIFRVIKENSVAQPAPQVGLPPPVIPIAPYVVPTAAQALVAAQSTQIGAINAAAQNALAAIVATYPDLEVATWPQQYAEAQAFTANNTAATPMLSAIASAASSTVAVMAAGVLGKASAYQAASGAAIGRRIILTAQIEAATTPAAVKAVVW
ncbi:MAG TPA: hypothetical protein PLT25_02145 [Acidocella sp.]|nr:hypothetical protein [Acidocella sp.]